jgi:hypothetical protein
MKIIFGDLLNKIKYGLHAPLYFETIWVDPMSIQYMIEREEVLRVTGYHRNKASGVVVDWDDIDHLKSVFDEYRIQYCFKHWKEGLSWDEIGVYEYMSQTKKYGSWPKENIIERFKVLDQAFKEAKSERRLKTRKEINPKNFREEDGILVHIGKHGVPYFGGNGFHRLAIAKVLELEKIPACIGMVDKDAIQYLKKFRNP